jgi:hypothetical protein
MKGNALRSRRFGLKLQSVSMVEPMRPLGNVTLVSMPGEDCILAGESKPQLHEQRVKGQCSRPDNDRCCVFTSFLESICFRRLTNTTAVNCVGSSGVSYS